MTDSNNIVFIFCKQLSLKLAPASYNRKKNKIIRICHGTIFILIGFEIGTLFRSPLKKIISSRLLKYLYLNLILERCLIQQKNGRKNVRLFRGTKLVMGKFSSPPKHFVTFVRRKISPTFFCWIRHLSNIRFKAAPWRWTTTQRSFPAGNILSKVRFCYTLR